GAMVSPAARVTSPNPAGRSRGLLGQNPISAPHRLQGAECDIDRPRTRRSERRSATTALRGFGTARLVDYFSGGHAPSATAARPVQSRFVSPRIALPQG